MTDYNIHFVLDNNLIKFESGKDPLKVTGLAKMIQILAKLVLSNLNEDFYDWNLGGHLTASIRQNPMYLTSDANLEKLALDVLERVKKIYIDHQETVTNPDERLAAMTLRKAYIDWERDRGVIEYNVVAESGKSAVFRMITSE